MSLRYRGAGLTAAQLAELGKVLIDTADTTADFLSPKLLVTTNLVKTIQNIGGNENILLDVSLSGIETTLDGRYVLLAPSGKNQTIQPLTDNIPLTLKGFAGAASDLLDLLNSAATKLLTVGPSGATLLVPSADVIPLTLKGFAGGSSDVLQIFDTSSPQVLTWKILSSGILKGFIGTGGNLVQLFVTGDAQPGLTLGQNAATSQGQIQFGPGAGVPPDTVLRWNTTGQLLLTPVPAGNTPGIVFIGTEGGNVQTRLRENAGDLVIDQGAIFTLKRNLTATATPSTVSLNGTNTIGTSTDLALADHVHQVSQNFGANFFDVAAIAAPVAPAANVRRVFVVSSQNQVSAETSAGTVVYLEGRGAPNIAVAKAAVSISVSLSPNEPDTSYEINCMPSWNTTVFYSAKAVTGFTLNFGTSPAAASTLDWTVDRRVSGSA